LLPLGSRTLFGAQELLFESLIHLVYVFSTEHAEIHDGNRPEAAVPPGTIGSLQKYRQSVQHAVELEQKLKHSSFVPSAASYS
jgi:hypothetical protein